MASRDKHVADTQQGERGARLRRQLDGQRRFFEQLATGQPLPVLLETLARTVQDQLDSGLCSLLLLDASGQHLQHGAAPDLPDRYNQAIHGEVIGPSAGACGTAAFLGEPVISGDIASDPRWEHYRELALPFGLRACWSVPFRSSAGAVLGTFAIYHREPRLPLAQEMAVVGQAAYLAGVAVEHYRALETLREREALYRLIAENSGDLIDLCDQNGFFRYVNPSYQTVLGYEPAALIGTQSNRLIHPDDHAAAATLWRDAQLGIASSGRFRCAHADGSWRWIETTMAQAQHEGQPMVVSVSRDVTARQEAREALLRLNAELEQRVAERTAALAASERFYRTLIEAAPQVIWFADADGNVTYANPAWCAMIQSRPEESGLSDWFARLPANEVEATRQHWRRLIAAEAPFQLELRLRRQDGLYRDLVTMAVPVRDEQGVVVNWVGIDSDITERKQAEQALTELNQELEAFSYSVSHDLRAPLRQIEGFLNLLRHHLDGQGDSTAERYAGMIASAATRMSQLISDLLAFSGASRADLQVRPVDLNRLIAEVRDEFAAETRDRRIHWFVGELPPVQADRGLLRVVLANLLANAIKYSAPRDLATIRVEGRAAEDRTALISISDNGVGFDMRYAHRVFGVFQRLHSESEFPGTGVGLATVRRIITRHGGQVWAESKPDQGARFTFTLRLADQWPGEATLG
jgi:PAS domain S-box-containing protein